MSTKAIFEEDSKRYTLLVKMDEYRKNIAIT